MTFMLKIRKPSRLKMGTRRLCRKSAGGLLALSAFAMAPPVIAKSISLCAPDEAVIFSCALGKKTASLCASKDLSATKGYLYYAYGKPGALDLSAPEKAITARQNLTRGSIAYSGGGTDYVRIQNGAFSYIVYSGIGKGWEQEGVVVQKDGKTISSHICPASMSALGPNGWQPVYGANLKPDTSDFEVPVR
jgi:hypothetical protein